MFRYFKTLFFFPYMIRIEIYLICYLTVIGSTSALPIVTQVFLLSTSSTKLEILLLLNVFLFIYLAFGLNCFSVRFSLYLLSVNDEKITFDAYYF